MNRCLALAAASLLLLPPSAAAEWRALRTEHFQVIGDVPTARLRDVALRFEQFRAVLTQLLPSARAASPPVVVMLFPDARAYRPFMPIANGRTVPVDGFFVDGADVNYITMNVEAGDAAFPAVFHEFSHLLLNSAFPNAPLWFNEGLAEYFSTFEVTDGGRRALIGKPLAHHVALLRERRLRLSQLFGVVQDSRAYTQDGLERDLLYAQSWAVVHHARHAQPNTFDALVWLARRLADGESLDGSVRGTHTTTLDALDVEIQAYVRNAIYEHVEFTFSGNVITRIAAEPRTIDPPDVQAWLADLLAHLQRGPEAIPRLEQALKMRGDLPRALATLGVLRVRQGDRREGLALLERAAAAGPDIESVQFEYGWALVTDDLFDGPRAERARAALERAIALHPGYPAAIQMLAAAHGRTGDFARMRDLLTPLVKASPANQDAVLQLASALLALGELPSARALIGPVLARPQNDELRERARTLLGRMANVLARP